MYRACQGTPARHGLNGAEASIKRLPGRRVAIARRAGVRGSVGQDAHFLEKDLWDFAGTPPHKYPLLLHYHPLNIYRRQVLKRADLVLALWLLGDEFSEAHQLLDAAPELTAVFAASDEMAMGALRALRDRGLEAGRDVSVIGVDGHRLDDIMGLTSVVQPVRDQGAKAAGVLLDVLAGAPEPAGPIMFPTYVHPRRSTARLDPSARRSNGTAVKVAD